MQSGPGGAGEASLSPLNVSLSNPHCLHPTHLLHLTPITTRDSSLCKDDSPCIPGRPHSWVVLSFYSFSHCHSLEFQHTQESPFFSVPPTVPLAPCHAAAIVMSLCPTHNQVSLKNKLCWQSVRVLLTSQHMAIWLLP